MDKFISTEEFRKKIVALANAFDQLSLQAYKTYNATTGLSNALPKQQLVNSNHAKNKRANNRRRQ